MLLRKRCEVQDGHAVLGTRKHRPCVRMGGSSESPRRVIADHSFYASRTGLAGQARSRPDQAATRADLSQGCSR